MLEQKKLVFIESNTTGSGEILLHKALAKKFQPVFITADPHKYTFLPLEKIKLIILDTNNKNLLLDYIKQIENVVGIHSTSDSYVETVSWLAKNLGLPGSCYEAVKLCRNKYTLFQALASVGIRMPDTKKIICLNEASNVLERCIFPVVIKPCHGTGSIGVRLCYTKNESLQHIDLLLKNNYSEILIQEYIHAPEFSVEVCSANNQHQIIGVTKKYLGDPPYFVEIGHDFPAILSAQDRVQIENIVARLLTMLGYDFGFSHIELKIHHGEVIIIEVNPRLAGGMIHRLIEKSTGIDLLDVILDLLTDSCNVSLKINYQKFASIRHTVPLHAGKIKRIDFKKSIYVDQMNILKKPGDDIILRGDFRDRIAYLIVSDEDAIRCKEKAEQAIQNVEIDIE